MHDWSYGIMEKLKDKVDTIGADNIDGRLLDDLVKWSEVCKNITNFEYHYKVIDAMEKADEKTFEEKMRMYAPETNL